MSRQGYVYFIRPVGLDGPIKIGCSQKPQRRLNQLSVWSPWPLEMVGFVTGTFDDERFMHHCFADHHSHREWFRYSQSLWGAIIDILDFGSVDIARQKITPASPIRAVVPRVGRNDEQKRCASYKMRVVWAERKLRQGGEHVKWQAPRDVSRIIEEWTERTSRGMCMTPPHDGELIRLDEYLADPCAHSVHPDWFEPTSSGAAA